jgi:RNA polymerase sigma factor (sigma-70 family)
MFVYISDKTVKNKEKLNKIIEGCLQQKRKHQEELFKLFYGKMLGVSMRYTKDQDTASEIVQTSFIKVYEKLELCDNNGNFEGWIKRIVINTAIDLIRKSKKDPYVNDLNEDYTLSNVEENVFEEEELELSQIKNELIIKAIQQLSPAYQTVFNLYVIEDYSHKEIAELLNISEGTSKSNLSKAKVNLQKILKNEFINLDL